MKLKTETILSICQHGFIRLDGAWFIAVAEKFGIATAWEMDIAAWKQFSYGFGKNLKIKYIPEPQWPESFFDAAELLYKILNVKGRMFTVKNDEIIMRASECEIQKAVAAAGIADCGILTQIVLQHLAKGLFGKEINFTVEQLKKMPDGDPYCEALIKMDKGE